MFADSLALLCSNRDLLLVYQQVDKCVVARTYVEMARAFNERTIRAEKQTKENTTLTGIASFCEEVFLPAFMQKEVA